MTNLPMKEFVEYVKKPTAKLRLRLRDAALKIHDNTGLTVFYNIGLWLMVTGNE